MKSPIFLAYEGDIVAFESVEAAEADTEALDVKYDEFVAYDAEGRLLSATWTDDCMKLSPVDIEPKHAVELAAILKRYLKAINKPVGADPESDLPVLVAAFGEFLLDFRGQPIKRSTK